VNSSRLGYESSKSFSLSRWIFEKKMGEAMETWKDRKRASPSNSCATEATYLLGRQKEGVSISKLGTASSRSNKTTTECRQSRGVRKELKKGEPHRKKKILLPFNTRAC